MKTKALWVLAGVGFAVLMGCGPNKTSEDGKGANGGSGGAGGKASGGTGGTSSGGSGGKASGGSGGVASGGTGGVISGGTGGLASGGTGGLASGGIGGVASGGAAGVSAGGSGGIASGGTGGAASNNGDTAEWNFEQQLQLWKALRGADVAKLSTSTVLKGTQSLELPINVTADEITAALPKTTVERAIGLTNPGIMAQAGVPSWSGKTITFHVWVPTDFPDGYFTSFIQGRDNAWKDSGFTGLNKGGWTNIDLIAPAVANAGDFSFLEVGLYFNGFSAPWAGSIFVDSVEVK